MSDFKETCIWMSYRYAIGRKSIASVTHAQDIAAHLDWIPKDRWEFTAKDITREINDKIRWWDNIEFVSYDNCNYDAFTVIFKWFIDNPQKNPVEFFNTSKWYINCDTGEVDTITDYEPDKSKVVLQHNIFHEYADYVGWIKLAIMLRDKSIFVTTEYEGQTDTMLAYEWIDCTFNGENLRYKYSKVNNGFPSWYIAEEYIKSVKPYQK